MNIDLLQYLLGVMTPTLPEMDDSSLKDAEITLQICLGHIWAEQAKRANQAVEVSNG
jgi:hypothetical protein